MRQTGGKLTREVQGPKKAGWEKTLSDGNGGMCPLWASRVSKTYKLSLIYLQDFLKDYIYIYNIF